jgi:pimeloyl-ACP methyl ester carboxylesterase
VPSSGILFCRSGFVRSALEVIMSDNRPFLVLFPGAWGNRTPDLATWWMRHIVSHFKRDYQIVVLTYSGTSLNDYVAAARTQLDNVPDGSLALCYSMGSQIARGVAAKRPSLFKRVALFCGLERFGVRLSVFLRALTFALKPMLRTLMAKPLKLDTIEQFNRAFLRDPKTHHALAKEVFERRMIPEPAWAMLRLFLPGLRQTFPPFPCPVIALVPHDDFMLPKAQYPGETIQRLEATGDHALIISDSLLVGRYLDRITTWFQLT